MIFVMEEFQNMMEAMRRNFYKEEYLLSEQVIVLNGLTKNYGKHRGINNLSFTVNKGRNLRLYRTKWGG